MTSLIDRLREAAVERRGTANLLVSVAATAATAAAGSLVTDPQSRWYRTLNKPSWQPPKLAFPLVWSALYADIAATNASTVTALQGRGQHDEARAYTVAAALNLVLNAGWSAVFFGAKRPREATVVAAALAVSSADLARRAARTGPGRAWALAPYAAWCTFATALSGAIARRNP